MNARFSIFPCKPDKSPLLKDWQDIATRDPEKIAQWHAQGVRAWGIPTGARNNLFVIDLDVDKETGECVGRDQLLAMPRYAYLYDHAFVLTPSRGRHIYLQHFEGARNSQPGSYHQIAPNIDTRGEGGYVIAPGSRVDTGFYVGSVPEVLPAVPMGLRAINIRAPRPTPRRCPDRVTPAGEVEELLTYIPADSPYQDWLSVLMALHDRFNGSEEGLVLADRWSATGQKYCPGEVTRKWRSFKRCGVNWATIPALARQHGADLSEIARKWAA